MRADADSPAAVLIVEDEFMVAMHMSLLIRQLGYKVVGIAVDRESAMKFAECNPDIVLVDCKLRDGLTGPAIGQHMAQEAQATVIYITANPHYVAGQHLTHPAILGVYPKPVNDNEIGEILEYALMSRRGVVPPSPPSALRPLQG